nr:uncharacterized ENTR1 family protein-like [Dermatophagoides farinae]
MKKPMMMMMMMMRIMEIKLTTTTTTTKINMDDSSDPINIVKALEKSLEKQKILDMKQFDNDGDDEMEKIHDDRDDDDGDDDDEKNILYHQSPLQSTASIQRRMYARSISFAGTRSTTASASSYGRFLSSQLQSSNIMAGHQQSSLIRPRGLLFQRLDGRRLLPSISCDAFFHIL